MPPTFGAAPKCPRCNDRVYAAEQVIGPMSKMYHRQCLKCIVCNRRLDSVSLLEHDGQPYCNNCHREHLGQGKDKFGTAVPVKPNLDTKVPPSQPTSIKDPNCSKSDTRIHGRRSLPIAPSGSQQPLAVPESLSLQNFHISAARPELEPKPKPKPKPKPSTLTSFTPSGTPLCARCQTPVCTFILTNTFRLC